jgi:hypothetical protein
LSPTNKAFNVLTIKEEALMLGDKEHNRLVDFDVGGYLVTYDIKVAHEHVSSTPQLVLHEEYALITTIDDITTTFENNVTTIEVVIPTTVINASTIHSLLPIM